MSLKNVLNRPPKIRNLALSSRLVLGYTLAAFVTLSFAGVFLYRGLWMNFMFEDAELLSDHVDVIRQRIKEDGGNPSGAKELIETAARSRKLERYYGRLEDEGGHVIAETPGFSQLAPPTTEFPPPVGPRDSIVGLNPTQSASGVSIALATADITVATNLIARYKVVFDVTHVEIQMRDYLKQLGLMVAGGTLFSAILGGLITNRGLKPLREITSTIQNITVSGLDEQVGSNRWPRELSALAAEFDKMLGRLHDSFQRLSRFTADAAHEFRTPMNNLMVSTSLTLSRERTADEYRAALGANLEQFDRIKRLTDSLLFLARAENAEAVPLKVRLQIRELVNGVVDFFSALAEEKGVALQIDGQCEVYADETLLRMAVTNLVSNALAHTAGGGSVKIRIVASDGKCAIFVSDTGTGIAAEHLPYVFDRFYRSDASRSSGEHSGSGLGLALVKSIVDLHHGSISVNSELGKGTQFLMTLPGIASEPGPVT